MKAINLLQHNLTAEQSAELLEKFQVTEFVSVPESLKGLLSSSPGTEEKLSRSVDNLLGFIKNHQDVKFVLMPGGSPAFNAIIWQKIGRDSVQKTALFAHSVRESVEQVQVDGSIKKVAVFKHCHFIEVEM